MPVKQLNRLVSVIKVTDFQGVDIVDREMVMVKVAVDERTRSELDSVVSAFRAHVVDIGRNAVTIEPGIGAVAFCAVVFITIFAAEAFDPRLMWDAAARNAHRPLPSGRAYPGAAGAPALS